MHKIKLWTITTSNDWKDPLLIRCLDECEDVDFTRAKNSSMKASYDRTAAKIAAASDSPKLWWRLVDQVLEEGYTPSIPGLEHNNKTFSSDKEKANLLIKQVLH